MRRSLPIVAVLLAARPAAAAELSVTVEIPRLQVAEYHRPYVAVWLERVEPAAVTNLAVWYDLKQKDNEGTKWLKDMRQWWRRIGRELSMPVDGITGATRAPGQHAVPIPTGAPQIANLLPGRYELVIEAARELGGRELLRLPFEWPPREAAQHRLTGQHELGAVLLDLKP